MEKVNKQVIYATIFLIGLAIFLYQSFKVEPEILAPTYASIEAQKSQNITAEELRAFLKTSIIYKERYSKIPFNGNLSYSTQDSLADLNPFMSRWLERSGWSAERYFYVGARLKIIKDTIYRDKEIKKLQALMLDGISVANNADLQRTLRNLAKEQEQALNIEKISQEEREMVEPEIETIQKLLPSYFN